MKYFVITLEKVFQCNHPGTKQLLHTFRMTTHCDKCTHIINEEDLTNKKKFELFQNCNCSNIIYEDIKEWFYNHPTFQKYYTLISNYDTISQHFDVNRSKSNLSKLFDFILKTKEATSMKIFQRNSWERDNELGLLINEDDVEPYTEENKEFYDNTKEYIPYYRPWYNTPCQNSTKLRISHIYEDTIDRRETLYTKLIPLYCDSNYSLNEIVISCMITFLFEMLTNKKIIDFTRLVCNKKPKFMEVCKKKLVEFKSEFVLCNNWKGSDYYYKKLFYKSIVHDKQDFDENILKYKLHNQFDLLIYGHPKASHGLAYECWLEIQDIQNS